MSRSHSPAFSTSDAASFSQLGFHAGSEPSGTATATISLPQTVSARWPVANSMFTEVSVSGITALRGVVSRPAIRRAQTVSAPEEPVKPVGRLSSYPTQTTATCEPENPANQLSRSSDDVPDLPATAR